MGTQGCCGLVLGKVSGASKIRLSLAKGYLGMIDRCPLRSLWPHDQGHRTACPRLSGACIVSCTPVFSPSARNSLAGKFDPAARSAKRFQVQANIIREPSSRIRSQVAEFSRQRCAIPWPRQLPVCPARTMKSLNEPCMESLHPLLVSEPQASPTRHTLVLECPGYFWLLRFNCALRPMVSHGPCTACGEHGPTATAASSVSPC